ncbi:XrtA/PEP-CTERM system TPR-repeat protein PrsT [Roseateles koreensis]|uniref:PEP-CTERM system TPR-repeat protein PrsT n=1 Tax=Roseateles koreensis TaxID=2987526 RepID=A0ABT5KZ57_9BURK|nr:XrtA/PEP-CTERM system TPR-repeat protein PrsT [Roseateles koreensis]MDC8787101.1 PEP-CTERM system TPR-repeat protein PrsT [Roseateles koreensis]
MTRTLSSARPLRALTLSLLLACGLAQAASDKASKYYEDALTRFDRKDVAGAILQLKNALQIDKTLLPVQVLLGRAYLANSEPVAAEVAFTEALRLGVNRSEIVVPLAESLVAQGKPEQVLTQSRLNLTGLPAPVQFSLLLVRASAHSDLGDARSAIRAIEDARAIDSRSPASYISEVQVRVRAHQFPEALTAADAALRLGPDSAEAWYQKGSVLHLRPDMPAALTHYERALQLNPDHVEARLARAGILLDMNRLAEAGPEVEEVLRRSPDEPRAVYLRALLADRAGKPAESKAALHDVIDLIDPVPIEFIRYRPQLLLLNGLAHFGLDEPSKAKPYLEFFCRNQANSPATKLLAQIYLLEPSVEKAVSLLEGYLKAQPGDGQAMVLLASAYMNQGRHAKASALMQQALRSKDSPEFRTALGLSLMREGQTSGAQTELEKAFKRDPKQTQAAAALVNVYLRTDQASKAVTVANTLVEQQANNPSFLNLQGLAKSQANDLPGARQAYERALKADPSLMSAKLGLARLDIAAQAFDAARSRLTALLKENERNIDALMEMTHLELRQGQIDAARRWLTKAVDYAGPKEFRPGFALIDLNLRTRNPGAAVDLAQQMLAKSPEDVPMLIAYSRAKLANGDPQGSRSTLVNASRRADYDPAVLTEIAGLQMLAGDAAGAGYSLEKALSSDAQYLPALSLMTRVDLAQGNPTKAEKRAQQVLQLSPKRAASYALIGDVAKSRGQLPAALEAARSAHQVEPSAATILRLMQAQSALGDSKAEVKTAEDWLRSHPKDLTILRALANTQARQGNLSVAKDSYERLLKQAPKDADALNNLAYVLMRQQDSTALKVAQQAQAAEPENAAYMDTLAWAHHLAGQDDRALQLLRDARLRAPQDPEIRYHLAAVLNKTGRRGEAKTEVDAALKISNRFESVADATKLQQALK